jgi:serine protease Do
MFKERSWMNMDNFNSNVQNTENKTWTCPKCGTVNTGSFCTGCGAPRPEQQAAEQPQAASTGSTASPAVVRPAASKKPKKQKRMSSGMSLLLAALIGAVCGFGGGYLATKTTGSSEGTTVIYTEAASTSQSVSVSSSGDSLTIQEIAAKASPSVVEIVTEATTTTYGMFGGTYTTEAAGSGVIISADGYIITNHHVIEGATSITVTTYDGTSYDATLIGSDEKSDIAVIKVEATDLTPATIGDSSTIQVGDTAVVIGNPLGTLGGTVTNGIISATNREIVINNESMTLIQTNAAINSGNSGGGLFNGDGDLIGIVNAKDSGTTSSGATIEGLGFAIPINEAMDVAEQLIEYGYVTDRATLGVTLQTLTQNTGNYKAGLYIVSVVDGSGAQAAGLQVYDRITAADGTEVSSYTDLSKILNTKSVGDTITLTIERNGETFDVDVTLTGALDTTTSSGSSSN